ncbi:hypothetical protein DY000_02019275 [Brassica cretica]|uniref:Uncharacterized protein n=1 Tax=Brassica cretica TaxID=69181 RepID=A0ABQ7D6R2_BRACR|nr:hypothetical protein DY000_02019275 [Brassica cretica]
MELQMVMWSVRTKTWERTTWWGPDQSNGEAARITPFQCEWKPNLTVHYEKSGCGNVETHAVLFLPGFGVGSFHYEKQIPSSNLTTSDECGGWTNEKHNLYLDSLENSLVKQGVQSNITLVLLTKLKIFLIV